MEKCSRTKSVFYILYENFSKIGPIIKKIPKFWDDPLNCMDNIVVRHKLSIELILSVIFTGLKLVYN